MNIQKFLTLTKGAERLTITPHGIYGSLKKCLVTLPFSTGIDAPVSVAYADLKPFADIATLQRKTDDILLINEEEIACELAESPEPSSQLAHESEGVLTFNAACFRAVTLPFKHEFQQAILSPTSLTIRGIDGEATITALSSTFQGLALLEQIDSSTFDMLAKLYGKQGEISLAVYPCSKQGVKIFAGINDSGLSMRFAVKYANQLRNDWGLQDRHQFLSFSRPVRLATRLYCSIHNPMRSFQSAPLQTSEFIWVRGYDSSYLFYFLKPYGANAEAVEAFPETHTDRQGKYRGREQWNAEITVKKGSSGYYISQRGNVVMIQNTLYAEPMTFTTLRDAKTAAENMIHEALAQWAVTSEIRRS